MEFGSKRHTLRFALDSTSAAAKNRRNVVQRDSRVDVLTGLIGLALAVGAAGIVWGLLQTARCKDLTVALAAREASLGGLQQDLIAARQECARVGAQLEAARASSAEKISILEATETRLREAFAALCSRAPSGQPISIHDWSEPVRSRTANAGSSGDDSPAA